MFNTAFRKVLATMTIMGLSLSLQAIPTSNRHSYYQFDHLEKRFSSWGNAPMKKNSIQLDTAWKIFKKKKDVVVAVIDTGIDPQHPFIKDNLFVKNHKTDKLHYGHDFSKGRKSNFAPIDQHGHGTHIAGIIKSIFPEVKLMILKYYNPQASGQDNLKSTIAALRYAVKMNVDIINYSGGGPEPAEEERTILKEAKRKGILVIAAAGNEESNIDKRKNAYYPASYDLGNIITVTAHDQNMNILPSSNYGKRSVDIAAPGDRIKSALPFNRAGYLTGTSQATAFVSGVAALIKSQNPALSIMEIKKIIKRSAQKELKLMGKCSSNGRLNAAKALAMALKYKPAKRNIANAAKKKKARIFYRLSH